MGDLNFSEDIFLDSDDVDDSGRINTTTVDKIAVQLEDVRSRSIAARSISITGKFRAALSTIGAEIIGVGTHRAIKAQLEDGTIISAYPAVGVPTAQTLNSVETKFGTDLNDSTKPFLIYDHTGIGKEWEKHLEWLDGYVANVELVDVSRAAWEIVGRVSK